MAKLSVAHEIWFGKALNVYALTVLFQIDKLLSSLWLDLKLCMRVHVEFETHVFSSVWKAQTVSVQSFTLQA